MEIEFDFTEAVEDKRDKGYICPCCSLFVKRYKRALVSNAALALLTIYKTGNLGFVHVEKLMQDKGYRRSGDFSNLVYWRFLEKCNEKRVDESSRNGMYRITPMGIMFCEMKIKAKKYAYIFNNKCEGFTGEEVDIVECLGHKFSYKELMDL